MENYVTPVLVTYGASQDLIKGDCEWGTEGFAVNSWDYKDYDYWFCGGLYACIQGTKCYHKSSGYNYYECRTDSACTGM